MTAPAVLQALSLAADWGIVLLFGAAVTLKLRRFEDFRRAVIGYRVAPASWSVGLAAGVVAAEALVAAAAAASIAGARIAAGVLLAGYAALMSFNLLRGRAFIDCGCGGPGQPISTVLVARNLALAAVFAVAPQASAASLASAAFAAGLVFAGGVCVAAVNRLDLNRALLREWGR